MAMPASAWASAAASLMPSPTIATRSPDFCKLANAVEFACRIEAGFHFGNARLASDGRRGSSRVAGEHQHP
jgi:hypothetical protein